METTAGFVAGLFSVSRFMQSNATSVQENLILVICSPRAYGVPGISYQSERARNGRNWDRTDTLNGRNTERAKRERY